MPNIKSAKKRVKVSKANHTSNIAVKSALKTILKKIDTTENKQEAIAVAIKKVDQAASKGVMHKNCAARKKSQLALKLNALKA